MIDSMHHDLQIIPIPAFKDNYIWLIHNGLHAAIVDPGDAIPVLEILDRLNLKLTVILITHHHYDHIDGVATLLKHSPDIQVYAPKLEQYLFEHAPVGEPDTFSIKELNIIFSLIDLPGHTLGHVAYYSEKNQLLFCGDTLFGAGCGRLFEGTASQMYQSLQRLSALPPATKVYCSHEYTLQNINFALTLEQNNFFLINRFKQTQTFRENNTPSLPSTIALERATNPFLRCTNNEIQSSIGLSNADPVEVFSILRNNRNHY